MKTLLHSKETKKLPLTAEQVLARAKFLATDAARAASILSAIQFRLSSRVTSVTEVTRKPKE
jgi:hypothetical protein